MFGNMIVCSFFVFISNKLFREGLNDYNILLGKLCFNYDESNGDYCDFFILVYFCWGMISRIILGVSVIYSDDIWSVGLFWM